MGLKYYGFYGPNNNKTWGGGANGTKIKQNRFAPTANEMKLLGRGGGGKRGKGRGREGKLHWLEWKEEIDK
jgi:hypothetical protein